MVFTTGDNNFAVAKWIVSATAGTGTHTTIASALTSASSGDTIFIKPGTYTENITLKAGVNLAAFDCDALTPNVIIVGKATFTAAGNVSISGIQLTTNSDFCLAVTGSAASNVFLDNSCINCSNNTGISFTSSSGSAFISIINCYGNLGTTGIAYYSMSSPGTLKIANTILNNGAGSSTASSNSAGLVDIENCQAVAAFSTSSTGLLEIALSKIDFSNFNLNCVTTAGTGTFVAYNSSFLSGSATAITVGSGTTASLNDCVIGSSNAAAISGAGTLQYSGLAFSNTSSTITTTTVTATSFAQWQQVRANTASVITCNTIIPEDNTIPQNTEGNQVVTVSITPKVSSNILRIQANISGTSSTTNTPCLALFQDTTANAIACTYTTGGATGYSTNLSIDYYMTAGTTSSTTFKVRAGPSTGTYYVNGDGSGNRLYGGVSLATLIVTEYSP